MCMQGQIEVSIQWFSWKETQDLHKRWMLKISGMKELTNPDDSDVEVVQRK